jgi:hypothetical protein
LLEPVSSVVAGIVLHEPANMPLLRIPVHSGVSFWSGAFKIQQACAPGGLSIMLDRTCINDFGHIKGMAMHIDGMEFR